MAVVIISPFVFPQSGQMRDSNVGGNNIVRGEGKREGNRTRRRSRPGDERVMFRWLPVWLVATDLCQSSVPVTKPIFLRVAHRTQAEKYHKKASKKLLIIFLCMVVITMIFVVIFAKRQSD